MILTLLSTYSFAALITSASAMSEVNYHHIASLPSHNLLVTANEKDLVEDDSVRAHAMAYQPADYLQFTSSSVEELIGWGAISGMVADAKQAGKVYAVNDSFYKMQPTIFEIDTRQKPAQITKVIPVTRGGLPAQKLDMEGITLDGKGGFWIASEGRTGRNIPHALYNINAKGEITAEVGLPKALMKVEKRFGFEGITRVGDTLWMAVQREWKDDPKRHVKLMAYNTKTGEWGAVHYPITESKRGWVGLSEITAHGDYAYIIERDNQLGDAALIKRVYKVALADMKPAKLGGRLPVVKKQLVRDLVPDFKSFNGNVQEKVEGLAVDVNGEMFICTDNDGEDDSSGETLFWSAGKVK
jgi:hypothetical protein